MIFEVLLLTTLVLFFIAINLKDLIHAIVIMAGADITLAIAFYLLAAPDVSLTQAAVVAGLMTFMFLLTIHKTERKER